MPKPAKTIKKLEITLGDTIPIVTSSQKRLN